MERAPRCPVCHEPLGVYEPLLAISSAAARRISLVREPRPGAGETVVHRGCASPATLALLAAGD